MTYCLGVYLDDGLVMASDSRTNAGVDQIAKVRKMSIFEQPGKRVIAILSAGNLGTTQAVITLLRENLNKPDSGRDLFSAQTMFEVARMVGGQMRDVLQHDGEFVRMHGDPNATFLVGGQILGEAHRLFQIYSAGNFIEASSRSQLLQIGETKYGKPILDRAICDKTSLDTAAKLALLSYDATIRSNLSVEGPIDLLRYRKDSFSAENLSKYRRDDPYWVSLRDGYSDGLMSVIAALPNPPEQGRK
ncbi:MAG: peptidase [Alphaproteobacteria bacterium]